MKKLAYIFLAGVAIAAALDSGCSKPPVDLKLKWQIGQSYFNRLSITQIAHLNLPGTPGSLEQETSMVQDLVISAMKALPDGATEMEMEFTGFKMQNKMAGAIKLAFDSSADPKNDQTNTSVFRQLVGARFKYEIDAAGKADKVTGMDELLSRVKPDDSQSRATLRSLVNEDFVKQVSMRGQGLPGKPITVGESWPMHLDENAGAAGVMQMNMNYRFTDWEIHDGHKCALIEFTGDMAPKAGTSSSTASVSVEKGTISGKEWFDPNLAMMVETDSDQNMTMKIMGQGKTINSQMTQKVIMKLLAVSETKK